MRRISIFMLLLLQLQAVQSFTSPPRSFHRPNAVEDTTHAPQWRLYGAREDEIRRKIMKLKKEGKIKAKTTSASPNSIGEGETTLDKIKRERQSMKNNSVMDAYKDRISKKLGNKSKLLKDKFDIDDDDDNNTSTSSRSSRSDIEDDDEGDPTDDDLDEDEAEMLEAVERALEKKRLRLAAEEAQKEKVKTVDEMEVLAKKMEEEQEEERKKVEMKMADVSDDSSASAGDLKKATSGVGGAWAKNETSKVDTYRPANGGWGYFPRPKDISRAYGGGKRIGAEVKTTLEDEIRKQKAVEDTREKLRRYREKVGIEVQSEKDHAAEIAEALEIGQRAMQRGVYGTAASALEKVTKWCSTNSKVGGQVFLELAMAYEAVGRTSEAIQIYTTLSTSRMENIKYNAKRLLYGIEAMQFMRNEAKSKAFSRKQASQTFIDTTGLGNIADNFDDKYNTAYIDLDRRGGFYKKLTESVVRSVREARQILLAATDAGEVDRTKIVQALRSIDRSFSDALAKEIKKNEPKPEPVAVMDGKPIVRSNDEDDTIGIVSLDSINMGDISQTLENIEGEWRLQLMGDSKGDGVNFYNKTIAWQNFDTQEMSYKASSPSGFLTLSSKGSFKIDELRRTISRSDVSKDGSAAFFTDVYSSDLSGAVGSVLLPQQIISVDSEMLVTRSVKEVSVTEKVKGYYSVWRRRAYSDE